MRDIDIKNLTVSHSHHTECNSSPLQIPAMASMTTAVKRIPWTKSADPSTSAEANLSTPTTASRTRSRWSALARPGSTRQQATATPSPRFRATATRSRRECLSPTKEGCCRRGSRSCPELEVAPCTPTTLRDRRDSLSMPPQYFEWCILHVFNCLNCYMI